MMVESVVDGAVTLSRLVLVAECGLVAGMSAHSTDTDFGAENVASNPRADEPPNRRLSRSPDSG